MTHYYWYTFADGYNICCRGFSKNELAIEIAKHGKLIRKVSDNND